jgi:hypothetical protein
MTTGRRLPARSFEIVCRELDRRSRVALGFERIRALLEKLANPQEELKTVQEIFRNRGKVVRSLIQKDADVLVLTRPKGGRAADPS